MSLEENVSSEQIRMSLEECISTYTNVSSEQIRRLHTIIQDDKDFKSRVESLHMDIENQKKIGRRDIQTRPLINVLSVTLQQAAETTKNTPLAIYGRIHTEYSGNAQVYELFNRGRDDAEILETSNKLTLTCPEWPRPECLPFSRLKFLLYDRDGDKLFAEKCIYLKNSESENDYEQVNSQIIYCEGGSINVEYIMVPFCANCKIEIMLYDLRQTTEDRSVNITGKVSIKYDKAYGNCGGAECVLFEKKGDDFDFVKIERTKNSLNLSRCWVASGAYSPITIVMDLKEFGSRREILNKTVEFLPSIFEDLFAPKEMDFVILVRASWFQLYPYGRCRRSPSLVGLRVEDIDEMDTDGGDESSDDESEDASSSDNEHEWGLHPHENKPEPSEAVEIFSVFIGREKSSKTVQIHGSIEVSSYDVRFSDIFRRDENDALELEEFVNTIPILDGSRHCQDLHLFGMKFDIKDVDGPLAIKGFVEYGCGGCIDPDYWNDKQICSTIRGDNGFAAVHYSMFESAVFACVNIYLKLKSGSELKVYGRIISQYSCFNYSTHYNRDYYRIVLFKKNENDLVQLRPCDIKLPLSRSMVVVPTYSSLVFEVDLYFQEISGPMLNLSEYIEFKIGQKTVTKETDDYLLQIELDWCEIK